MLSVIVSDITLFCLFGFHQYGFRFFFLFIFYLFFWLFGYGVLENDGEGYVGGNGSCI